METALITYSTHSAAAESLAKAKGLDYEGHKRAVGLTVASVEGSIRMAVNRLKSMAISDGSEIRFHKLVLPPAHGDAVKAARTEQLTQVFNRITA